MILTTRSSPPPASVTNTSEYDASPILRHSGKGADENGGEGGEEMKDVKENTVGWRR